jgi:hypothetical protein
MSRDAKQRPEVDSAAADASPAMEQCLRERFKRLLGVLSTADSDEAAAQCVKSWRADVATITREALCRACEGIGPGSPLRDREAVRRAEQVLSQAISKLSDVRDSTSKPGSAETPKRQTRK